MPTPRVHPDRQMTSAERSRRFRDLQAKAEMRRYLALLKIATMSDTNPIPASIAQQALSGPLEEGSDELEPDRPMAQRRPDRRQRNDVHGRVVPASRLRVL